MIKYKLPHIVTSPLIPSLLLMAGVMLSAVSCQRRDSEELLREAMTAAQSGDWEYAREYARRAGSRDEREYRADMLLGLSHYYLNDKENAIPPLRRAAERLPENFTAQYLYGWILCENDNYPEALPPLRRAFEMDDQHPQVLALLVRACLEQNLIEGVRYAQRLMSHEEYRRRPEPLNAIGILWMGEPNYQRANAFFQQALQRQQDNPVILQNLAVLHDLYLNDRRTAIQYYRRCMAASQQIGDRERFQQVLARLQLLRAQGE